MNNAERHDLVKQRWASVVGPDFVPFDEEIADWLRRFKLRYVLQGVNVTGKHRMNLRIKKHIELMQDELIVYCESTISRISSEVPTAA